MPDKHVMAALDRCIDSSQIVPVCKRYFDALLSGEDLLGVYSCCTH